MTIFKAYDIRGIYPEQLNEQLAYNIGRAFVTYTKATEVMIGRDGRLSSPILKDHLVKGITDQGASVVDIGITTTPMLRVLHKKFGNNCAIQVTASHNPKEYGGFKLFGDGGVQITGNDGIPDIEKLALAKKFPETETKGTVTEKNYLLQYIELLTGLAKKDLAEIDFSNMNVVVDPNNGPASLIVGKLLDNLGIKYEKLNFELDGNFPGHDPNPLHESAMKQAGETIKKTGADFACIFDADADRAIFVDEKGEPITTDHIMAALSADYIKQYPGSKILYDCVSSHAVKEAVEKLGGTAVLNRTGSAFMCLKMKSEGIIFGGETSGHYFYKSLNYYDHSIYTLIRVLKIVAEAKKPLSEIVKGYKTFYDTNQINIEVNDAKKAIDKVKDAFQEYKQWTEDGILVELEDGNQTWFIARPSNTELLIRTRFESKNKETMIKLKEKVLSLVK